MLPRNIFEALCFLLLAHFGSASELTEASADHAVDDMLYRCPEGTYFSHHICLECPSGHFCLGDVSSPQRCPVGTFNLYTRKSHSTDCKPCFPGLISAEDRVDCRLCPSGFSCDVVHGTLSLCPPGLHSPEGILHCLSCPVDAVCISGFPHKCDPGSEPNFNHTKCNECPPGFYSSLCTFKCMQCPAGSYCPEWGMSQPLNCPLGWSSTAGQMICQKCNDSSPMCGATVASHWSQPVLRSSQPTTCRPGTYQDSQEGSDCVMCPNGFYCVGGVALPCPAGTYGAKEGLHRLKDCTICPAGFYCLEGSSQRPTSQFLCPQGYYCEEGTATPHGSPCPAGTAGEQLGQTSRAACKRCKEGRFCPAGSSGPGLPCARGRYCPAGTLLEVICPHGTFTPHQGAISVKDCLKCPAGFYCPAGISDPVPCPSGTFNPLEGQDELADCRECFAGKACTQVALRAPDVDCMQGYVCPPGSSKPNSQTNACTPGTLSNRTDLTDRSQCLQCPARYACLRGTGGIQRPPLSCFAGHYCPPGTMFPTQYKCPVGTWSGQSGLEFESECQPCPQGWYCLAGSGAPTGRCNSGHYCPEGTAYGTQFPCPSGTYSIQMGNTHRDNCLICPEGFICPEGTSKPSPCPRATFRLHKGGQKLDDCLVCPAGYFCPHSATVNPRVCGVGSYSDEGSVECAACLRGHYCSNETTSEEAMLKVMVCPAGFLCSQGLTRDPQRSATLCPRGFYCPGGGVDPNPIPCPNGTYSPFPGLRDVRDCLQCPDGKYCYSLYPQDQPITSPSGPCPNGHFCPPGTGYPFTYPCLSGQYRNNTLGHSGQKCVLCPARHYCEKQGTHTPSVCPQGFYCAEGTSFPEPCPEGTYSTRSALGVRSECSPCGGGEFCNGVGLKEATGQCKARYYCQKGAKTATPVDGVTGGLCPAGSYCPFASHAPLPCPPGTYSNSTGLSKTEECAACPPGFYCLGFNNTSPSGACYPGYYCTEGSTSPVQHEAQRGHYTLERSVRAEPCPTGTFQTNRASQSCVECPGGRLCNQTGMSQPLLCPTGHYCPPGSTLARPCPTGFFSDQFGGDSLQHCRPCDAGRFCGRAGLSKPQGPCASGHYCTSGAFTAVPVAMASGGVCPSGYFCPRGTRFPQQHPCPTGTWSDTVGAVNLSFCHPCPPGLYCNGTGLSQPSGLCHAGYYCVGGAFGPRPTDSLTGDVCPVGHHCPLGSSSPFLCPDGTFSNSTGAAECDECPMGTYCLSGDGVQPCPAGHYCLGGGVAGILPCPPGTYNPQFGLSQMEQCLICPAGFFCEDWGLFEPTGPCQAGYYCIAGVNFQNPDGNFSTGLGGACPQGKYCPQGTTYPLPCPAGTFSQSVHLTDASGCSPCLAGHFCGDIGLTHPSGLCKAGFYCPGGDTTSTGSQGGPCPAAHFCPEASASPEPCQAGSYNNLTGRSVCARCPAGYYCPEKTANFTEFPCPPGFYCPDGTRHATQFPCPRGYYNPEPMTQSLDSCLPCPPGHYCEKERLTEVSGKCKAGWFCVSAAWTSQPFDLDNYTNANCLCPATATGGRCQPGFYCPIGSSEPLPCPPGAFCNISGLSLPTGPCSSGYYCVGGAAEAKPLDGETGNICPLGTYCVEGSAEPELCPSGTFSPITGLNDIKGCLPCPPGSYCSGVGLSSPTGPCAPGYWCPPGQVLGSGQPCPLGHFCPLGSSLPVPCPSGTYQDQEMQESCVTCKPGYFCVQSVDFLKISSLHPCPKGHYCPEGTSLPKQYPCPVGSFNPSIHADSLEGCVPCPPGNYCPSLGLTESAGPCEAGYWCRGAAFSPTPLDNLTGSLCPPGQYCPSGTTAPIACPNGTWSNGLGLKSQKECTYCLGGHFCDGTGLTKPTGPCLGGYYCVEGAVTSTPTDGVTGGPCPEGYHCPEGSIQPMLCPPGKYVSVTQASDCEPCLPGWYCVSGSFHLCPAGFYCPEGTGFDLRGCPVGTYGPDPGYWSESQCKQCDGGHYCSSRNGTAITGPCEEGYYCSQGNTSPKPSSHSSGEGGPCPVGHFCPMSTAQPFPCPLGTFSNLTKLTSQEDCQPCLPGHFCDTVGLSAPTGKCWEGFFCLEGADRPDPILSDSHGGPCPKGYYCSEGSVVPQQCPMGTISAVDGLPSCSMCPQGFYCPVSSNGTADGSYECPMGHYCPSGTWSKHQYPCPVGSINPHFQMATVQDCLPCPPGSFCAFPGESKASGLCRAGYYCLSGAWSPTPTDGGKTGDRCPEGHYCPQGSSAPTTCPSGYYSNNTSNVDLSDCLPCLPGFLCAIRGLSFPTQICPAGSFCPAVVNSTLRPSAPCSAGNMCPPGSDAQLPCLPGTYQSSLGQAECVECPAGFYCAGSQDSVTGHVSGTQTPLLCPSGYYCPGGTKSGIESPCPAGTFSSQMGLSSVLACELCPPGRYCSSSGQTSPKGLCSPGYFCIQGSVSGLPEEGPTGGLCSAGSYCPEGTTYMVPCPAGTFSSTEGGTSLQACRPCAPGYYCAEVGLSAPSGPCLPGFYCTEGSRTAMPQGFSSSPLMHPDYTTLEQFHGDLCPVGHYCPEGSEKPTPCPPGSFSGRSGAESEAHCEPCNPGHYCPFWAQAQADLLCPPGWFCPAGSVSGHQPEFLCPAGRACPLGSAAPSICSSGQFQTSPGQPICDTCPPGSYCLEGSVLPSSCPVGTINPSSGRRFFNECLPCPLGFFCNTSGLSEPTGACTPGHFCARGSTEPAPLSQPYGDICPIGHFCPEGSGSPKPCPSGSFRSETGASSSSHCHLCPPGKYCLGPGSSGPTGLCSPGFFCVGGSDNPTPRSNASLYECLHKILNLYSDIDDISALYNQSCFTNTSTLGRNESWIEAVTEPEAVSENIVTHTASCLKTPHYACAIYKGDICPEGFFCPRGSPYPLLCPTGFYCNQTGLGDTAGPCAPGFFCPRGSNDPYATRCPEGHYCPQATPIPLPCPVGTIQDSSGGVTAEACQPCPPGHYCHIRGLSEPSGQCAEGYHCPGGQTSPTPQQHVCSAGHFCPKGSFSESPCPLGSYQYRDGQGSCEPCPAGFFCQVQGTIVPQKCEKGFYCPNGSAYPNPCPSGTYGNTSGLKEEIQCSLCDPGMYCKGTGRTDPSGPCAEGFVCNGGASEPSPVDSQTGRPCPAGFYCLVGTYTPQPCPKGTYSEKDGLVDASQCTACTPGFYCSETGLSTVSGPCLSGFYCVEGSLTAAPKSGMFGDVCPKGHFCPKGSSVPTPCPAGSYLNITAGKSKEDCKPCPVGQFQDQSGQNQCNPCPPGFHCQAIGPSPSRWSSNGVSSPEPCPAGYTCPRESLDRQPVPCPKGTYSQNMGLSTTGECLVCPAGQFCGSDGLIGPSGDCDSGFLCIMGATVPNPMDNRTGSLCPPGYYCKQGLRAGYCLAGYYCDWGSSKADQRLCPAGFFCPRGTPAPLPCPPGTFSSDNGNTHQDNCTTCLPGYYCQGEGTVYPTLCPAGHYCPPGLILGKEFPCPPGTVQRILGASNPDECVPCPSGMFCSDYGLSEPSGLCDPGYFCPSGSSSSNSSDPQTNSTESRICPAGHYCPIGTGHPRPCPVGSFSISDGVKEVDGCQPCPSGLFCDRPALADILHALPCHAGYVCLGGSYSPAPSDSNHGYKCPAGHRCPLGSAIELPCEPGTYSAAPGAAQCLVCPNGTACSSFATIEPTLCPAGHFCPSGTALPQPCPMGTLSNQTGALSIFVCSSCPSGFYCSAYGAFTPSGFCLKGYFCQSGATEPAPQNTETLNGPCPVGHYCPTGCPSPIPCPLGSIRNSTGGVSMESCTACPAGYYCSNEGLSNPSGPCAAGFYCPFDFSSTTPYAFLCPKGHYCPVGSPLALPCPIGEYQPNPGSDTCVPCRPGFYCEEAVVGDPWPCPPHSFCPAGTMVPQPCPNGTFTFINQTGLQEEQECLPCPAGKFCRAGRIQGVCAAGFLCLSGSAEYNPQNSNLTQCQWDIHCTGPCPPGYYCPEGTDEAKPCPANTIQRSAGGASTHDCLPCPPKYWCKSGDPVLHPCPSGHYCDGLPGSDYNGGTGPRPCPRFTYRSSPGAGSKGDCLPCPAGSHCNSTGLTDYSTKLCPPGYWCSGYGPPMMCPAGSKRSTPGAATLSQCEPCAGGTFCPDPRSTGSPNVEGIPCRAGYQCPLGASGEKLCRAGSYCGPQTAEPQICPAGYFCPLGSHSFNTPKQLCLFPYYCPANSTALTSCEGGSMPVNTTGLRGSQKSSCSLCEGGTYRLYLSTNLRCLLCPPGYFCPQGTDNYKTHPCPRGYVCPSGSSQPKACPPGSFGKLTHAVKNDDCHPCPAGTFNHLLGQKACFPCGSSSTSSPGSPLCMCIGKNRAFQPSDGSCLCRTGFVYYDEQDFRSSSLDSVSDCQPEVNRRCAKGEVRLAASRACASPDLHSCNVTCGPHGGTLDVEMGICQCERYVSAEELCNASCLSRLPRLSAQLSSDGQLLLSLNERKGSIWARFYSAGLFRLSQVQAEEQLSNMLSNYHTHFSDVLGPDIHAQSIGKLHIVEFGSKGIFGWIPTQKELIQHFLSEPVEVLHTRTRERRETGGEGDSSVLPRIPNPIACISSGDMLFFQLTINDTDRHQSHFPVYLKDHLFNSNPSWDFGAFRQLQILMKQTHFNSTRFVHVFSEPGKYVLVDSAVPEWTLVVVVTEKGVECNPRAAVFQPMTPAQLVKFGIVKQHQLNLLPDWGLIAGFLSLFLALVVVLTSTVLVLRPEKSKLMSHWKNRPKWRNVGEPFCPVECTCAKDSPATPSLALVLGRRGEGEGAEAEEPAISKGGNVLARCDLEEFNVKTLYDKLEDQNLHIASQLVRHRKDTQEFYRNMCQQTETLINIFENMDSKKLLLLRDLLIHSKARDNPLNSTASPQDEAFTALLGAVIQSVEALLGRMTVGETWHHQYLVPHDDRESDPQHGDTNMCYTQFSSTHLAKEEAMSEPAPFLSDHDLSKLVSITPLFKTLQDIQQSLQNLTGAECSLPDSSTDTGQSEIHTDPDNCELVATALDSLSPQHSAVYLLGCQVMQLLSACRLFPPVPLLLAKSVPTPLAVSADKLLTHCSRHFYFDATNQILYLSEKRLSHAGHFISILLQSMAHIAAGSKPEMFMKALHEAVSVLGLQLFKLSFMRDSGSKPEMSAEQQGSLVSEYLSIKVPAEAHFAEHLLASRLEKYKYLKVEQLISKLKQCSTDEMDRANDRPAQGSPVQISCVEEEIDRLNESFLQLSVQLQNRAQLSRDVGESSPIICPVSASPSSTPSLSRNGTILLELKRRCVSQRLNELQITLEHIRRSQQHDSNSQDGTRSLTQTDSSSTQPGPSKHYPGTGSHSASDDHRQDSPSNSHEVEAREREDSGDFKYESQVTEQRLVKQASYPHGTLLEAQQSQSQLQAT